MHWRHSCLRKIILKILSLGVYIVYIKVKKLLVYLSPFSCKGRALTFADMQSTHHLVLLKAFEGGELRACRAPTGHLSGQTSYCISDQPEGVPCCLLANHH